MTNTVVGLLRHGQTDWNIDFRLQGIADIPLNATGVAQAEVAGLLIDGDDWDVLLTSPLSRAKATAEIVAKSAGFDLIHTEPLLLERSFGEAEGLLYDEWKSKYEDTNLVPGAETLEELEARERHRVKTDRPRAASHSPIQRRAARGSERRQLVVG